LKKKILFCTDSPGYGGAEKDLITIISYLKEDFDVELLVSKSASFEIKNFIKEQGIIFHYHIVGNRVRDFFLVYFAACTLLLNNRDKLFVIWCHHLDSFRWLQLALAIFKRKYIIVERIFPSSLNDIKKSKLTIPIKKFVCSRSYANVICAYSQVENYRKFFAAKKITVIPNSRNIIEIKKTVLNYKKSFIPEIQLKGIRIVSIGRLTEQKDPLTVINAVNMLKNIYDVTLVLVGDGELMDIINNTINSLKLDNVILIGYDETPLKWLAHADIFILNSTSEGLPGALIEAMAASIPCIATDIPGNRELLINNTTGLSIPINNISALAKAISHLIENSEERKLFAKNGYEHVLKNYDSEIEKEQWFELLKVI
jgi:glycosyltransferase involved in cell wall biosynthesis